MFFLPGPGNHLYYCYYGYWVPGTIGTSPEPRAVLRPPTVNQVLFKITPGYSRVVACLLTGSSLREMQSLSALYKRGWEQTWAPACNPREGLGRSVATSARPARATRRDPPQRTSKQEKSENTAVKSPLREQYVAAPDPNKGTGF